MDLWWKPTGNEAGSKLHGKLAALSGAVCLNDGAICLFWRGSPALMLLWLYDQMTLFTRGGNINWHTLQLLSPNQRSQMECSCCKGFSGTFWSHESAGAVAAAAASVSAEQLKHADLIQASARVCGRWWTWSACASWASEPHCTQYVSVGQSWPDLVSLTDVTHWFWLWGEWPESYRQWQYNGITYNSNFLFLKSV